MSHWGTLLGNEHYRRLGRKLRRKTVRGGEPGLRKESQQKLTSKRAPIDVTPLTKTPKPAIHIR
jgi:hypothetical protein